MVKAILGTKLGMTQIFDEQGQVIPVTVVQAGPCMVVQTKKEETDGYNAIQVGFYEQKENRLNKPLNGHFAKAQVKPLKFIKEFRVDNPEEYSVGQDFKANVFEVGDKVDVSGISKGKGFTGSIKRHNFARGPMAHGSRYHRGTGALGALGPSRVFKGRKLPGHMGREKITVQNLEIVKVDAERNLILIKGAVPGSKKALLTIKASVKSK